MREAASTVDAPDTDEASPRGRRASAGEPRIDRSWTKLEKDIVGEGVVSQSLGESNAGKVGWFETEKKKE